MQTYVIGVGGVCFLCPVKGTFFISPYCTKGLYMTRVLQIRRGTAAQHKNFVGMPGEITMDTDNKTIRLHDGITLGGITVGTGGNGDNDFDINSVPDEFWANIVAQYAPAPFKIIETKQITFTNNSAGKELVVGGNDIAKFIQSVLV
jgi:hypothetical protein